LDPKKWDKINEVARFILRKMYLAGYIGEKHTAIENLPKGLPSHMGHYVDKAVKSLIKENYIIKWPTSYGKQVSLNVDNIEDIKKMIGPKD
jgi:hypothetical protein